MSNNLYTKMARIMGKIGTLEKDKRNDFHRYDYASDQMVYTAVRQQLAAEGLALFASMTSVTQDRYTNAKQKEQWHTVATFEFVIVDGESGETYTCTWQAEAQGDDDKGINKCATAALKYWLLKTFIIPTGDDPDGDQPEEKPPASKPSTRTTKQPNGRTNNQPAEPDALDAITERWAQDKPTATKFWNWATEERGLTGDDILAALDIKRLSEYTGSKEQAVLQIDAYIMARQVQPDPKAAA